MEVLLNGAPVGKAGPPPPPSGARWLLLKLEEVGRWGDHRSPPRMVEGEVTTLLQLSQSWMPPLHPPDWMYPSPGLSTPQYPTPRAE